uniref:SnoaL-like domain-containing protein n=1 Tax=Chromera velia CCMP2878 TaxID=1169474 RepID=A0A0G4IA67_9ALVE|mmetsp:Transcript_6339/g.12584  ORF Transcript_6339/g.12584 Transcript_6339/m.12584 type:complete len:111 (+) Transcript_6339:162-494(+)|eukprot:Cvel_12479.t1-p1 / transcript=Cvel_12479.t1 / gene=Cvel_12479 / organism=Chromera_velia_CCMP2878 / gene_product=hypothetical protein / transcript_product=hypothetical protein / location=Cvel_scaffold818:37645-37974(+) / protein_length=110 / sequence_SO=supercontig / SO=protein_coding / is_pseudo=false
MAAVAVVQKYVGHFNASEFDQMVEMMAEDIQMISPKENISGKKAFGDSMKANGPKLQKEGPTWGPVTAGPTDAQAVTVGTKKMMMMTVTLKRTFTVNGEGKIAKIEVAKA